jgi:hypothetical protein
MRVCTVTIVQKQEFRMVIGSITTEAYHRFPAGPLICLTGNHGPAPHLSTYIIKMSLLSKSFSSNAGKPVRVSGKPSRPGAQDQVHLSKVCRRLPIYHSQAPRLAYLLHTCWTFTNLPGSNRRISGGSGRQLTRPAFPAVDNVCARCSIRVRA